MANPVTQNPDIVLIACAIVNVFAAYTLYYYYFQE